MSIQIIKEKSRPSFLQSLGMGLGEGIEEASHGLPRMFGERMQKQRENDYLSQLTGTDFGAVQDPEARKLLLQGFAKRKEDDKHKFVTGLETIKRMREIAAKNNIGRGSSIWGFFPGETAKDRAEYAQLGTSLIPLVAAGVPIRNQKEFEQYRKVITDPSSSLSEIEGALNGLQSIFEGKLGDSEAPSETKKGKTKFNPKNPDHMAKLKQLDKKFKQDRDKVNEALAREFTL